jgi:hypothetical protein
MRSASRSVTMTRPSHRGQGRKSRLLAKLASPGGTHSCRARPFRRSLTGSDDIGICPGGGRYPEVGARGILLGPSLRPAYLVRSRSRRQGRSPSRAWRRRSPTACRQHPDGRGGSPEAFAQVRQRCMPPFALFPPGLRVRATRGNSSRRTRCRTRVRAGRARSCACSMTDDKAREWRLCRPFPQSRSLRRR